VQVIETGENLKLTGITEGKIICKIMLLG
jgi:hypothetical protein